MIDKIKIKNFQSQKASLIKFHPGVNVIIGPSDNGKSDIIRSLQWFITGRPLGMSFVSWGRKTTSIDLTINGQKINRTRSKSKNTYTFEDMELLAGNSVPEIISNFLKIDPEISIQAQMDGPFLLSGKYTPGAVATFFNSMTGLEDIDLSNNTAKRKLYEANRNVKETNIKIQRIEEEQTQYEDIPKLDKRVQSLEKKYTLYKKRVDTAQQIGTAVHKIHRLEEYIKSMENRLEGVKKLNQCLENHSLFVKSIKMEITLRDQIYQLKISGVELSKLEPLEDSTLLIRKLKSAQKNLAEEQIKEKLLKTLISNIKENTARLEKLEKRRQELRDKLAEEMPDSCPLCERPF